MLTTLVMASVQVEAALINSNYVDNIMVFADPFHNYCVAIVVPARGALEQWAQQAGIKYNDFSELCAKGEAVSEVQQSLSKVHESFFIYLMISDSSELSPQYLNLSFFIFCHVDSKRSKTGQVRTSWKDLFGS